MTTKTTHNDVYFSTQSIVLIYDCGWIALNGGVVAGITLSNERMRLNFCEPCYCGVCFFVWHMYIVDCCRTQCGMVKSDTYTKKTSSGNIIVYINRFELLRLGIFGQLNWFDVRAHVLCGRLRDLLNKIVNYIESSLRYAITR